MPATPRSRSYAAASASALITCLLIGSAYAGGFTAEQAEAGRTVYQAECAQCHGTQLEGPEAPGLIGQDVMGNWSTAGGLYDFISVAMPPAAPGKLGEDAYLNIVAYIMQMNGAKPGDESLTADAETLASINLVDETKDGAAQAAAGQQVAAAATGDTNVPQAFTWGKKLPGSPQTEAADSPSVPQAYTWGKKLPQYQQ